MKFKWDVPPQPKGHVIELTVAPDDPTPTITMQDAHGNTIGNVRVGSLAHWAIIKQGGKVVKS